MKIKLGMAGQSIILFLILFDSIILFLTVIANLRIITITYISYFDLIVSLILLFSYLYVLITSEDRKNLFATTWPVIIVFIPISFISLSIGLSTNLLAIKILNIIKILGFYYFAQKFTQRALKYQQQTRLVYAVAFFLTTIILCSFIFYTVEHPVNPEVATYEDSLWFILQTITTVGYGDIIPVTNIGRIVGVFSMFGAIILTTLLTSVATFSLIEKFRTKTESTAKKTREYVKTIDNKLDDINNHLNILDKSEDLNNIKNDINDLKLDIKDIKDIMNEKK